ncbi:protein phosphatase 2C domain-containing protein [Jeotgalibacillus terrae]|uniref:Protein phosphatase 2C domain-containing protein n=1 Tax=Jeotgalibacillus terrae TaxID=587735 RepID=A0ABW5ZJT9_9BACL
MTIGLYGGNSDAGQTKNEDGCLIWSDPEGDWEFVMLLDAHHTAESTDLVLKEILNAKQKLITMLTTQLTQDTFTNLEKTIISIFSDDSFLSACQTINGETACLITVRKHQYIWWFSVGDCLLYLFHGELMNMGQVQLNQRQFFEWIGKANTFDQLVSCYSTGRRELRSGNNRLFLTTDGLIECPGEPYADSLDIYRAFNDSADQTAVEGMLNHIRSHSVKDSTTLVTWEVWNNRTATRPDDTNK